MWRSLVAHLVRDQEAAGAEPAMLTHGPVVHLGERLFRTQEAACSSHARSTGVDMFCADEVYFIS